VRKKPDLEKGHVARGTKKEAAVNVRGLGSRKENFLFGPTGKQKKSSRERENQGQKKTERHAVLGQAEPLKGKKGGLVHGVRKKRRTSWNE